ncbi:hypothetical protein T02_12279 [Trichinella nativa]|uniref:Uncharacterized protein n=1 Tax=Trichinella nativa TaxID=6335 RepID=A0A0V1LCX9_9BILA|nr:hypothetical protein T02_12279 [Trichinella nativa]
MDVCRLFVLIQSIFVWLATGLLEHLNFKQTKNTHKIVYEQGTLPFPGDENCADIFDADSSFLCDVDQWLTVAEASDLYYWLRSHNYITCFEASAHKSDCFHKSITHYPSLFVSMVDMIRLNNASDCFPRKLSDQATPKRAELDSLANNGLFHFTSDSLEQFYADKEPPLCQVDIFLLLVKAVTLCDNGVWLTLRNHRKPMLGIALRLHGEQVLQEELTSSLKKLINTIVLNGSLLTTLDIIKTTLSALQPIINHAHEQQTFPLPESPCSKDFKNGHHIPKWAMTTFIVSVVLILFCTFIGYFINSHARAPQFCDPNPFTLINFGRRNGRKWRAGFGGGLI